MSTWQETAMAEWKMINRLAMRRFPSEALAEEAALFVINGLAEDNWRRLRAFSGKSSAKTYIAALTHRLLEDFARKRFGRIKPPAWVHRLGGIWTTLFKLLCLERYTPDEAVAIIKNRQPASSATLEHAAYTLLGEIPSCGEYRGEPAELVEEANPEQDSGQASSQQLELERQERAQLLTILGRMCLSIESPAETEAFVEKISELSFDLAPEETLLLQLCYRDGLSVAEAGRMLGLNRYQVHGRLRRLLERIRNTIRDAGLEKELRQLL
ncbi:sigma-70 family RNA polymerase sigma factor [Desulfogranum japonicum]|uniref:sigma-70 family RNA polymerase sigma factor n=1 Tax=Desulfogranum japonicum TaxID=231447 RepID=UPI00041346C6|nr:sigma-70 family RNA polymerase sigma factor [Desulfogranum japonicum]